MSIAICLADSQRLFREGLCRILDERRDFDVVAQASGGEETLRTIGRTRVDVALVDAHLTDPTGLEVIERIRQSGASTQCIALSAASGRCQVEAALRAGAAGYVPRDATVDELCAAIEDVAAGRYQRSSLVAGALFELAVSPSRMRGAGPRDLTPRQREILDLIAEGRSAREIGSQLGLAPKTVENHRSRLMARLDIHKTTSLVRFALEEGLVGGRCAPRGGAPG